MPRSWHIGFAANPITPPAGVHLAGYALRKQGNIGVLDPVFCRALAIADGHAGAVILSCDLLGLERDDIQKIKTAIRRQTGLATEAIFIAATHTHSGPASMHTIGIGDRDEAWMEGCLRVIIATAVQAWQRRQPGSLRLGIGETDIGVNRRGKIRQGSIHPAPDPRGTVDRTLTVLWMELQQSGTATLMVFHCGCHPTVLGADNRRVSADFPGATHRFLKAMLGEHADALFLNGAAGNVNPKWMGDYSQMQRTGRRLAEQIVEIGQRSTVFLKPSVRAACRSISVPFARLPSESQWKAAVREYEQALQKAKDDEERAVLSACLTWARRMAAKEVSREKPAGITAEIQVLCLGDLVLLGLPFEVFAETSLALKRAIPNPVMVCGYSNGNFGYLPPAQEIAKGGYEVEEAHKFYGYPAHFAATAEEKVVNAARELLERVI